MSEEVKVVVRQESQGNALSETQAKMEQLKAKIAELNQLEKAYTEKGLPTAAASTRSERIPYARELRDLSREQRTTEKAAAAEKASEEKSIAAAAKATADEKKATQREEARSQQQTTRELREQEAIARSRATFLRRAGAVVGSGALAVGETLAEDYLERRGIAQRDQAQRASDARSFEQRGTRGFSSGEAVAAERATEDAIFQRQNNRPEIERRRTSSALQQGLVGLGAGAYAGAQLGTLIAPGIGTAIGGGIGAAVGAGVGATRGWLGGSRELEESDKAQQRDSAKLELEKADRAKRYREEVHATIEAQERMNRGDVRGARAIQDKVQWSKDYNHSLRDGAEPWEAQEAASANYDATMKARAGKYAGLISARDGAADTARVAAAAANERGIKIEGFGELAGAMKESSDATWRKKFSRPAWGKAGET